MIADYKKAILEALIASGGCWSSNLASDRFDEQAAMRWLYTNEYIRGMGNDWKTAVYCITDKGRDYLKSLEETK